MSTLNRAPGAYDRNAEIARIDADWAENPRWQHAARTHSADDVVRLRGSMKRDNMLARRGAEKLWDALAAGADSQCLSAFDAATGVDAIRHVQAGIDAINLPGQPIATVRQINQAFARADQLQWKAAQPDNAEYIDYFAPLIADAEASHGGVLGAYELMQNLIRAGAAGVQFADRLIDRMGETALMSAQDAVQQLIAARLAADVEDAPTLIVARTSARTAELSLADCADCDQPFVVGERSDEDHCYRVNGGIELAIARGLAYAPYADLLWFETEQPDLIEAKQFAETIRREYPDQLLAFSCADNTDTDFQRELAALGYTLQFSASDRSRGSLDSRAA